MVERTAFVVHVDPYLEGSRMQRIEVRTPFEQMGEAFDQLAHAVGPDRVTFLWDRPVHIGEFVGFRIGLSDGTPILEGGGICAEMVDLGAEAPRSGRYRLVVTGLEMDALNARSHGRIVEIRRVRTAPRRSSEAPQSSRPSVVPRSNTTPPRIAPASGSPARTRVFGRPSESPLGPDDPHDTPTVVAPVPRPGVSSAPPGRPRYSVPAPPPLPAAADDDEPIELLVPRTLVARAESLRPRLAATQSVRGRELSSTDSLLRHALRMGIAALEAQVEAESETAGV